MEHTLTDLTSGTAEPNPAEDQATPGLTLPEIYRKAAELVLTHGKMEGNYGDPECGFCAMGAVLFAASDGHIYRIADFENTEEFKQLIKPIADRIVSSGRSRREDKPGNSDGMNLYTTIYHWNDGFYLDGSASPTAQDVVDLLNEVADAVETSA